VSALLDAGFCYAETDAACAAEDEDVFVLEFVDVFEVGRHYD